MSDFDTYPINSDIQTPDRITIQKNQEITDAIELLELMEMQIRWTKILVNREVYYTCVLDEIVTIQTELDHVAYLLLTENAKKCIAERLQDGNPEALEKLFVTTGRFLKM